MITAFCGFAKVFFEHTFACLGNKKPQPRGPPCYGSSANIYLYYTRAPGRLQIECAGTCQKNAARTHVLAEPGAMPDLAGTGVGNGLALVPISCLYTKLTAVLAGKCV